MRTSLDLVFFVYKFCCCFLFLRTVTPLSLLTCRDSNAWYVHVVGNPRKVSGHFSLAHLDIIFMFYFDSLTVLYYCEDYFSDYVYQRFHSVPQHSLSPGRTSGFFELREVSLYLLPFRTSLRWHFFYWLLDISIGGGKNSDMFSILRMKWAPSTLPHAKEQTIQEGS